MDTCITIFSPPGAKTSRWQGSRPRWKTSVSTKLGITRIRSRDTSKSRTVTSFRKRDTAVTPCERMIEKRVMGWKEGCSPTRVTSVPCRVVTRGGPPFSSSIARAIQADVAWGIA